MEPTSGKYDVPVATYPPGTHTKRNVAKQVFQGMTSVVAPSVASMAAYHPLYCIKTMLQAGTAKSFNDVMRKVFEDPRILFRGMGTSVFCSTPLAVKGALNDYVNYWYGHQVKRALTEGEKMSVALMASGAGGVFATVFEQVVGRQQLTGENFVTACNSVRAQGIKGFWVTVIRETQFGGFVFGVSPFVYKKIRQCLPNDNTATDYTAATVTSLVTGFFGAVVSQPTDVVKTMVQTNATMTYSNAVRALTTEGPKAFFKGLAPRAVGFALVTNVITISRMVLDQVFDKKQK